MGPASRCGDVQHPRHLLFGTAHAHDDPPDLDQQHPGQILPGMPRRIHPRTVVGRTDSRRTIPLRGRLPPVHFGRNRRADTLFRSGLHPRKRLSERRIFPLALPERRLFLARHERPAEPHGFPGPAYDDGGDDGKQRRPCVRQPLQVDQLGRQFRRNGQSERPKRPGRNPHRCLFEQPLLHRRRRGDRLQTHDLGDGSLRIPHPLHH